jgi:hypothetical protein
MRAFMRATLIAVGLGALVVLTPFVSAQETAPIPAPISPTVLIADITASETARGIDVSFSISSDGLQEDVHYGLVLYQIEAEGGLTVVDTVVADETLSLRGGVPVARTLSYSAPEGISGEYHVSVVVRAKDDIALARNTVGVFDFASSESPISIQSQMCSIGTVSTTGEIVCTIGNGGSESQAIRASLVLRSGGLVGVPVRDAVTADIMLEAEELEIVTFGGFSQELRDGSYTAELSLLAGDRVVNRRIFEIQAPQIRPSIINTFIMEGETPVLSVVVNRGTKYMGFSIASNVSGSACVKDLVPLQGRRTDIPLTSCFGEMLTISFLGEDGAVVDAQTISIPDQQVGEGDAVMQDGGSLYTYAGVALLALLVLLFLLGRLSPKQKALMVLALFFFASQASDAQAAAACNLGPVACKAYVCAGSQCVAYDMNFYVYASLVADIGATGIAGSYYPGETITGTAQLSIAGDDHMQLPNGLIQMKPEGAQWGLPPQLGDPWVVPGPTSAALNHGGAQGGFFDGATDVSFIAPSTPGTYTVAYGGFINPEPANHFNYIKSWTHGSIQITVVPPFSCQGSIPTNASRWDAEEESGLSSNTPWSYASPDSATKCQFRCDVGTWNAGSGTCVVAGPSCTGSIPTNASRWDAEEESGLSSNTPWSYASPDSATKCQFRCDVGTWNAGSGTCVVAGPSCTGSIPTNAAAWDSEESTGLSVNTPWSYASPDSATKCQFKCDAGTWNGSSCVTQASCAILGPVTGVIGQTVNVSGQYSVDASNTAMHCAFSSVPFQGPQENTNYSLLPITGYLGNSLYSFNSGNWLNTAPFASQTLVSGVNTVYGKCKKQNTSSCVGNSCAVYTAYCSHQITGTPSTYPLTVTKAGSGSGTVTSNPAGINCGATCNTSYASDTDVILTAVSDLGSTFIGWQGCDAYPGGLCEVTMNAAKNVTATFSVNPLPLNLTSTEPPLSNGQLWVGVPASFTAVVYNSGLASVATPFVDRFTRCWGAGCIPSTTIDDIARTSLNQGEYQIDGTGESKTSTEFIPSQAGTLRVQHCVDVNNNVSETHGAGESDNCQTADFTVSIPPNLTATNNLPADAQSYNNPASIAFSGTVFNADATTAAKRLIWGDLEIDWNQANCAAASSEMATTSGGSWTAVPPGWSAPVSKTLTKAASQLRNGTHCWRMIVDRLDIIAESNNDDNGATPWRAFTISGLPECSDGVDNDGDGLIDYPNDPGCEDTEDPSELQPNLTATNSAPANGASFTSPASISFSGTAQNAIAPTLAGNGFWGDIEVDWNQSNCAAAMPDFSKNAGGEWDTVAIGWSAALNATLMADSAELQNGTHCWRMIVDRDNFVAESNETDNGGTPWRSFTINGLEECGNGIDDDGDGLVDGDDPACDDPDGDGEDAECTGTIPAGASQWSDEEQKGLTRDVPWQYSSVDTARKCEFRCDTGVMLNNQCIDGEISADPTQIQSGGTSVIDWSTSGNTDDLTCGVTGGGSDWSGFSGTETTLPLSAAATYILGCSFKSESVALDEATVSLFPPPTLTPDPRIIEPVEGGTVVRLDYDLRGNTSCVLTGGGLNVPVELDKEGNVTPAFVETDPLFGTTTFTLTCGSVSTRATVELRETGHET